MWLAQWEDGAHAPWSLSARHTLRSEWLNEVEIFFRTHLSITVEESLKPTTQTKQQPRMLASVVAMIAAGVISIRNSSYPGGSSGGGGGLEGGGEGADR